MCLPALTPNLCLPALTPNLNLLALAPNLCLPALTQIFIDQPWPGDHDPRFVFTSPGQEFTTTTATSTITTTTTTTIAIATTTYDNNKICIEWPLKDI